MTRGSTNRWWMRASAVLLIALLLGGCAGEEDKKPSASYGLGGGVPGSAGDVPLGLPELKIPEDNPMSAEKVELGKLLYFDKRLSKDGTVACATCHDPQMAWAEDTPTSTGIDGQVGGANSPTVINAAYAKAQFWDGRAAVLGAGA